MVEDKKIVVGILAHVDSGKTTLSEAMLYKSGEIKKLGRVDHKNTFLDTHAIERERAITIFSKQAVMHLGTASVTILDTPGHVDFSPEMERTLQILDYAVLIVNGADGVQSHTEALFKLLKNHKIPTFIFINKMDSSYKSKPEIMKELKKLFGSCCVEFSVDTSLAEFKEEVAVFEEVILDAYIETGEILDENINKIINNRKLIPCFFGSALKLDGVENLLNALEIYTKMPKAEPDFSAKIFKINRDSQGNRCTHIKVTGGRLKVREQVGEELENETFEKINQIRIYSGEKYIVETEVFQGTVCALVGLANTRVGQVLGASTEREPDSLTFKPVLNYQIEVPMETNIHEVYKKLSILGEEEPQLQVVWNEKTEEINIQLMGQVQLEIIKEIMLQRFGIHISFGKGRIIYMETINEIVEGIGHFEPLRHYAEVHLLLEPLPPDSGLIFSVECREDGFSSNWQNLVLTHLKEKQHKGVLTGSAITDMKITLVAGKGHPKHTEGGDFREATYRAVRQGLMDTKSVLLEPWYDFRLELPIGQVGKAMSDIQKMFGSVSSPITEGETAILEGSVPVATMENYQLEVNNYTKGKGKLVCSFLGYRPCHNDNEIIENYLYDPESDLANSANSVFCNHGSGFIVMWDKVRDYMHLPSVLHGEKAIEVTKNKLELKDSELTAILERTYGKDWKDKRRFDLHKKENPVEIIEYKPIPFQVEYLLVDGYNVIFSWEDLKKLAEESLDLARSSLIKTLCNYQGVCQNNIILVFDAYKVKGNMGEIEKHNNITVVYTKEAETADTYIEKATYEIAKNYNVRVVTSDALQQIIIFGHGALRTSSRSFREEVTAKEKEMKEFFKSPYSH